MKRLLALFGIEARIRRVRAAVGQGAMAAEDRAQLLRMAWEQEKHHLKRLTVLAVALIGLTFVMAALLSAAVVVHFWDTPQRATVAWLVAGVWLALWVLALVLLLSTMRGASEAIEPARRELARDWDWLQARFGSDERKPREPRPATQQALLDRIERQRQRFLLEERFEAAAAKAEVQRASSQEPIVARTVRLVREHPVAAGAAAAVVVAVVGPRRLARLAGWVLPILWKLR